MDPFDEPVVVAIEESIDLHHFQPAEVLGVVDAYLDAAREAGFVEVRLIHGRGKGVQRANVRRFLARDPRVVRFEEAEAGRGGWGATLAWLRSAADADPAREDAADEHAADERAAVADAKSWDAFTDERAPRLFLGDVQGCADELDEMLARAERELGSDFELWSVGDLVNRGPDNLRVLERVRALHDAGRARIVLGNHEIGLMMKALGVRALGTSDTVQDVIDSSGCEDWIGWLRALPFVETGRVGGRSEAFAMVHASVHPRWSLEELQQEAGAAHARFARGSLDDLARFLGGASSRPGDAAGARARDVIDRLTRCRSVAGDGERWSDALPEVATEQAGSETAFVPWHALWSAREHAYGVVYGHWALQGLHVARGLRGLDTGCVHHGRDHDGFLTAWVPANDGDALAFSSAGVLAQECLWQVRARRRYYR